MIIRHQAAPGCGFFVMFRTTNGAGHHQGKMLLGVTATRHVGDYLLTAHFSPADGKFLPELLFPSPVASHFIVNPYPVLPSLTETPRTTTPNTGWLHATCRAEAR